MNGSNMRKRSVSYLETQIEKNQFQPEWFAGKMKVKFREGDEKSMPVNLDVKIRKDSAIWISASPAIGIKLEVARALITPGRIQVLDKFNKNYYDEGFDYLQQFVDYSFDFQTLQSMLFGSITEPGTFKESSIDGEQYRLDGNAYTVFLNGIDFSIDKMILEDQNRSLIANFDEYQAVKEQLFSLKRDYLLKAESNYLINVQFSKIKTDGPFNLPFTVSSKYKKVDP